MQVQELLEQIDKERQAQDRKLKKLSNENIELLERIEWRLKKKNVIYCTSILYLFVTCLKKSGFPTNIPTDRKTGLMKYTTYNIS